MTTKEKEQQVKSDAILEMMMLSSAVSRAKNKGVGMDTQYFVGIEALRKEMVDIILHNEEIELKKIK